MHWKAVLAWLAIPVLAAWVIWLVRMLKWRPKHSFNRDPDHNPDQGVTGD